MLVTAHYSYVFKIVSKAFHDSWEEISESRIKSAKESKWNLN